MKRRIWLRILGCLTAVSISTPALAEPTAFDRIMAQWDKANPAPKWEQTDEQWKAQMAAAERACSALKANLVAVTGVGNTPAYHAAFKAYENCTDKASRDWRWQNDADYRAYHAWSERRQQAMNDAVDGKLSPSPKVSPSTGTSVTTAEPGGVLASLRPTIVQEDHNPAGEAADCIRVIYAVDFDVEHVSSTQKAAFRNRCSKPVEVTWCTLSGDCHPGYSNLATVPARKDRGFSYEPSIIGSKVAYAACYNGFVQHQGDLSKKLLHACK